MASSIRRQALKVRIQMRLKTANCIARKDKSCIVTAVGVQWGPVLSHRQDQ